MQKCTTCLQGLGLAFVVLTKSTTTQVENMSTAELQQQLQARGVDYEGLSKFQLQDSLWKYIQVEAGLLPAEDTGVSHPLVLAPHCLTESDAPVFDGQSQACGEALQACSASTICWLQFQ